MLRYSCTSRSKSHNKFSKSVEWIYHVCKRWTKLLLSAVGKNVYIVTSWQTKSKKSSLIYNIFEHTWTSIQFFTIILCIFHYGFCCIIFIHVWLIYLPFLYGSVLLKFWNCGWLADGWIVGLTSTFCTIPVRLASCRSICSTRIRCISSGL